MCFGETHIFYFNRWTWCIKNIAILKMVDAIQAFLKKVENIMLQLYSYNHTRKICYFLCTSLPSIPSLIKYLETLAHVIANSEHHIKPQAISMNSK